MMKTADELRANPINTNLRGANLINANLRGVNLSVANLRGQTYGAFLAI